MMRAGTILRLAIVGLAGVLALPLVVGVPALRGPASAARAADGGPSVITTVSVGSVPVDVAVDAVTNRVYVGNWGSNNVTVIDSGSNAVAGTPVPVGSAPQDVAVNSTTNRICVANWGSNDVTVIDGATGITLSTTGVGAHPVGVAINPATNRIYVANWVDDTVSVIDGETSLPAVVLPVGHGPQGVAVNPSTNRIYVANSGDNTVSAIEDIVPPTPSATATPTPTPRPATPTPAHPQGVGGKVLLPPDANGLGTAAAGTGPLGINLPGLVAQLIGLAMLLIVLAAVAVGGWYARRRWQR